MCRYTHMPPVGGANCTWGVSSNYGDSGGVQYKGEQGRTCDYEDPVVPDANTCGPTTSVAALPLPPLEGITLTQRWASQTMDWCRTRYARMRTCAVAKLTSH